MDNIKNFTPKEIVSELDKNIIGQSDAKKSVAIALRNRYRRRQLSEDLQKEIIPKNILMIGTTGVGKTEIARRLAKLDNAPFIKVEATKFTEVGYVGRDVEQIIRDLAEIAVNMKTEDMKRGVTVSAEINAISKVVDIIAGEQSSDDTKKLFRDKIIAGTMDDKEIEIQVKDKAKQGGFEVPGMQGAQFGIISIDDILGKEKVKTKKVKIPQAIKLLMEEESEKLLDKDEVIASAINTLENNGIVFIDEIDKIASGTSRRGDVSREGVQRDLLPLVEGTVVNTKYGQIKTDHILFIASGAFHLSKPSDLLPELQGRFPIRVELSALSRDDFKRILTEPQFNLIKQSKEMLKTEGVDLIIEDDALDEIADLTVYFNNTVENIGARRLHTVLEKILEEINFNATDTKVKKFTITKAYVQEKVGSIASNSDLSKYII